MIDHRFFHRQINGKVRDTAIDSNAFLVALHGF